MKSGRDCWPQAEAMVGFINAFQLSGDAKYLVAAELGWAYTECNLVDRVHGEWFWRIKMDGCLDASCGKKVNGKDRITSQSQELAWK